MRSWTGKGAVESEIYSLPRMMIDDVHRREPAGIIGIRGPVNIESVANAAFLSIKGVHWIVH